MAAFMQGMESSPSRKGTQKKKRFNWKDIEDNGDGTFSAYTTPARKRLLKEYHRQGITIRSKKQEDGVWLITPVGTRQPRDARRRYVRQRAAIPRPSRRMQYAGPPPRLSPTSAPQGPSRTPRPRGGPSAKSKIDEWSQRRYERRRKTEAGPYLVDEKGGTKLREGYIEYKDKYGNIKPIRSEGPGVIGRLFESKEHKEARHEARVQQGRRLEAEMMAKSTGPSTRIPGPKILQKSPPQQKPPMATMTQIPKTQPGIRTAAAAATTQVPIPPVSRVSHPPLADAARIREERVNTISGDL